MVIMEEYLVIMEEYLKYLITPKYQGEKCSFHQQNYGSDFRRVVVSWGQPQVTEGREVHELHKRVLVLLRGVYIFSKIQVYSGWGRETKQREAAEFRLRQLLSTQDFLGSGKESGR